ncbi:MAG: hypothetical protein K9W43_07255 [Candidatus Thorarchaeota archaeon]|nr:hypothetical protein [Candidatus Thorarchaeota archaeon]
MLQIDILTFFLPLSIVFIAFGVFAFGWLAVHVEHSRHFSKTKVALAGIIGAVFFGLGLQFLMLWMGV